MEECLFGGDRCAQGVVAAPHEGDHDVSHHSIDDTDNLLPLWGASSTLSRIPAHLVLSPLNFFIDFLQSTPDMGVDALKVRAGESEGKKEGEVALLDALSDPELGECALAKPVEVGRQGPRAKVESNANPEDRF
jgi:hypothetical protein